MKTELININKIYRIELTLEAIHPTYIWKGKKHRKYWFDRKEGFYIGLERLDNNSIKELSEKYRIYYGDGIYLKPYITFIMDGIHKKVYFDNNEEAKTVFYNIMKKYPILQLI